MSHRVSILAVGAGSATAVGSRIAGFASGLSARGWAVDVVDIRRVQVTIPSPVSGMTDQLAGLLRGMLEKPGVEGDVMPLTGWRARTHMRDIETGIAIVSVPPFSLLWVAAQTLPPRIPLVMDYRDPWSTRHTPPLLARATRSLERHAVGRAAAMTYAGGLRLGELLVSLSGLAPARVVSVPNGHDPADLARIPPVVPGRESGPLDLVFAGYWYGRNGPGILLDALTRVGPSVATLTIVGGCSPSIQKRFEHEAGRAPVQRQALPRSALYQRLSRADAAVITLDSSNAVESRIPAKTYDYLAVGVPVIAICPPEAALVHTPGADRFHHVDHRDIEGLAALLRQAATDRTALQPGLPGAGPPRDQATDALHNLLLTVQQDRARAPRRSRARPRRAPARGRGPRRRPER